MKILGADFDKRWSMGQRSARRIGPLVALELKNIWTLNFAIPPAPDPDLDPDSDPETHSAIPPGTCMDC